MEVMLASIAAATGAVNVGLLVKVFFMLGGVISTQDDHERRIVNLEGRA